MNSIYMMGPVLVVKQRGVLNRATAIDVINQVEELRVQLDNIPLRLFDMSEVEENHLDYEDIQELTGIKVDSPFKQAIYAPDHIAYSMSKMFEHLDNEIDRETFVSRDLEQCAKWLGINTEVLTSN